VKVKILETFDSVTPQYFYFNGDNIIGLNIQNRYKYNIYYSVIRSILPIFQEPPAPPGISLSPIFAATWEGSAKKVGITWDVQDMIGLTWTVPMIWINYQQPFSINQGYGGPATVPIETPAAIIQKISEIEGVLGRSLTNRIVLHPGRYNFFDAWFGATGDNIPAGISYTAPTEVYVTPWGDRGVDGVSAEWNAWLTAYQGLSGPLNYLVLDKEGIGQPEYFTLFGITGNGKTPTKYLAALTGDARFNQSWRGATALSTLLSGVTLSLLLLDYQDSRCNFEYIKWWMYTRYYGIYGINKALWDNTKRLYPDAKGSNFESVLMTDRPAPNLNGHPLSDIGLFGSAAAPSAYGRNTGASAAWWIDQENPSQLIYRNSRGSPPRDTNNVLYGNDYKLTRNVWSSFQLDNQLGRACRRTAPNVYLHPWIANYKFAHPVLDIPNHTTNFTHYWSDKKYYYENIRHYALLGAEVFLYFNSTTGNLASQRIADTKAVDVVLEEVNTILGGSKVAQTVTVDPISFTNASAGFTHPSRIITTGAKTVNDSYVWRTTVAPGITLIKNQAGVNIPLGNNVGIWDITDTPTPPVYTIVDTAPAQPLRSPIIAATWEGVTRKTPGGTTWDLADLIGLTWTVPIIWVNYNQAFSINQGFGGLPSTTIETPAAIIQKISEVEALTGKSLTNRVVLQPGRYNFYDAWFGATADNIPKGICYTAPTEVYVTPWADVGVEGVSAEWGTWISDYKLQNGRLDYLTLDKEGIAVTGWWSIKGVTTAYGRTTARYIDALTSDTRFSVPWR